MPIRKLPSEHSKADVGSFIGSIGHIFYDPTFGSLKLSDGITPGGITITPPAALNTADNTWYVDTSRTDINPAVSTGSFSNPFLTITAALEYIEAKIADGSLSNFDETSSIVINPQFIVLTSSTVEDITLTRGHIYIIGNTPNSGHIPIWIQGHVTITPQASTGNAKAANDFGLFHVAVLPSGANHGITITGSNPSQIYLQDVYVYQDNSTKSCVYANNTGTGTTIELSGCRMGRSSGSTFLIDIQRGHCKINDLETNGIGQALNFANDSTGTLLYSTVDANIGAVITLSGSAAFGMGNCILNNTSATGNSYGINMSGTAGIQFGTCTFNIPSATGPGDIRVSNRAINGGSGNYVIFTGVVFQYGTNNQISTEINTAALTTSFINPP